MARRLPQRSHAFVDLLVAFAGAGDQRPWPSMDVQLCAVATFRGRAVFGPIIMGGEGGVAGQPDDAR